MTPSSPRRSRCRCLGRPGKRGFCAPLSQPPSKQRSEAGGVSTLQLGRRLRGYRDAAKQADLTKMSARRHGGHRPELPKRWYLEGMLNSTFFSRSNSGVPAAPYHLTFPPKPTSIDVIPWTSHRPTPGHVMFVDTICETLRSSTSQIQGHHRVQGWGYDIECMTRAEVSGDMRRAALNPLLVGGCEMPA